MPYATQQDIVDRYGQESLLIAADPANTGTPDDALVTQTLADAGSLIDGYIQARYTLPIAPVPPMLTRCAVDIAVYQMSADCDVATEEQRKRYDDALARLKDISKGLVGLGIPDIKQEGPGPQTKASFSPTNRRFTRETLRGF